MNIYKYSQLIGTVCGGLIIGLPTISQVAIAQEITPGVNPCPKIFYEEPHNNRVLVPAGCPPNIFTQKRMEQGQVPATPLTNQIDSGVGGESLSTSSNSPQSSYTPPQTSLTPEQRQEPRAIIALTNGKANIKLINETAANVTYQVIGDTAPRILTGNSDIILRDLSTPTTITFQREDGGLIMVTPQAANEKGTLEVTLAETTDVKQDNSAMRIQANGSVFLN